MLQYLIPLDLGIERSINSHQGRTTIIVNPCPHHDTTTTETIMFQNTIGGITSSALNDMKQDWSETITVLHHARLHRTCSYHDRSRSARWCAARMLHRTARLAWRPTWHRRLITVREEIRLSPRMWPAVEVAVLNLSRRCINRMYRSWAGVVALSRPDLDLWRVFPVL